MSRSFNVTLEVDGSTTVDVMMDYFVERDPVWLADKPFYATITYVDNSVAPFSSHILATSNVHGTVGAVVGVNNSQILTNKTLTSPVISTGVSGTAIDTDPTLAANSNVKLVTERAIKAFVESFFSNLGPNLPVFTDGSSDLTNVGTLPISQGGTGQTTVSTALNALLPPQFGKAGKLLKTDGINAIWDSEMYWITITWSSQNLLTDHGYIIDYPTQSALTLPLTSDIGNPIEIVGKGPGGWILYQNPGQQILFGDKYTTAGTLGTISSFDPNDSLRLICITSNTVWRVVSSMGNLNIE